MKLKKGFQIDFLRSGIFHVLLEFEKTKLTASGFSPDLPNISNSLDNIYLRCSLLSDSIVSGKRSSVLYSFPTSTKKRSLPFEIQPNNYLWNRINTKTITEARFFMTDDEDREVDLNGIDVSLTLVMKKLTKNGKKEEEFRHREITWGAGFSDVAAKMKKRMKEYLDNYLKPKKWTYLTYHEVEQTTSVNSFFRISTEIRKPRHVFV